jgi:hypothetical protein
MKIVKTKDGRYYELGRVRQGYTACSACYFDRDDGECPYTADSTRRLCVLIDERIAVADNIQGLFEATYLKQELDPLYADMLIAADDAEVLKEENPYEAEVLYT